MTGLLELLKGGDRRSIGRSNAVVRQVLSHPSRFREIIGGLSVDDPLVRMRCADAAEKVSAIRPRLLAAYKRRLLQLAREETQKEVRWHLAQMLPRLRLTAAERAAAASVMFEYLGDQSQIVKVFSMQALAEFALHDPLLCDRVLETLSALRRSGGPAVRARARKLERLLSKAQ